MRVLLAACHPLPESFSAALRERAQAVLLDRVGRTLGAVQ